MKRSRAERISEEVQALVMECRQATDEVCRLRVALASAKKHMDGAGTMTPPMAQAYRVICEALGVDW